MERRIKLQTKEDLMYLAGALCHGVYTTESYENQTIYTDQANTRCRFNIIFEVPENSLQALYERFS